MASPRNNSGDYFCFGMRSYILVKKCSKCREGVCDTDHHFQSLLEDLYQNRHLSKGVSWSDLDVSRPKGFEHVRTYGNEAPGKMSSQKEMMRLVTEWEEMSDPELVPEIRHFNLDLNISYHPESGFTFNQTNDGPRVIQDIIESERRIDRGDYQSVYPYLLETK